MSRRAAAPVHQTAGFRGIEGVFAGYRMNDQSVLPHRQSDTIVVIDPVTPVVRVG